MILRNDQFNFALIVLCYFRQVYSIPYVENIAGHITYFMEDNFLQASHRKIVVLTQFDTSLHIMCSNVTSNYNNMIVNWKVLRTGNNTTEFIYNLFMPFSPYYDAYTPNNLAIIRLILDGQAQ